MVNLFFDGSKVMKLAKLILFIVGGVAVASSQPAADYAAEAKQRAVEARQALAIAQHEYTIAYLALMKCTVAFLPCANEREAQAKAEQKVADIKAYIDKIGPSPELGCRQGTLDHESGSCVWYLPSSSEKGTYSFGNGIKCHRSVLFAGVDLCIAAAKPQPLPELNINPPAIPGAK